jgi:hypothetical protein
MDHDCLGMAVGTLGWTMAVECRPGMKAFNTCHIPFVAAEIPSGTVGYYGALIAPGERLVLIEDSLDREQHGWIPGNLTVYRRDGSIAAGPTPSQGWPLVVGADGVIYTTGSVKTDGGTLAPRIVAHSRELEELWQLDDPDLDGAFDAVLDETGVLYYLGYGGNGGFLLVAIQTQSPGLAQSSWPSLRHDNHRTQWLGGPVRDERARDAGIGDSGRAADAAAAGASVAPAR